ncbi:MAG TPA: hypothetical protein PKA83_05235, partial [Pirellulaceae bacterium]|nr:hypothetical protein [Pirellulaceae bacterium]
MFTNVRAVNNHKVEISFQHGGIPTTCSPEWEPFIAVIREAKAFVPSDLAGSDTLLKEYLYLFTVPKIDLGRKVMDR